MKGLDILTSCNIPYRPGETVWALVDKNRISEAKVKFVDTSLEGHRCKVSYCIITPSGERFEHVQPEDLFADEATALKTRKLH